MSPAPKRKRTYGCLIAATVALLVLFFLVRFSVSGLFPNYSNGSRAGVVTKLSNKGMIWKSWEGQMVLGGISTSTTSGGNAQAVANVFDFNADPSVAGEIEKAMLSGERIELVYHQWKFGPIWIDDDHVVYEVRHQQPAQR